MHDDGIRHWLEGVVIEIGYKVMNIIGLKRLGSYYRKLNAGFVLLIGKDKAHLRAEHFIYLKTGLICLSSVSMVPVKLLSAYGLKDIVLFWGLLNILIYALMDLKFKEALKNYKRTTMAEFIGFSTRVTLYISGGLTPLQAWEKSISEKECQFNDHARDLLIRICSGFDIKESLENFASKFREPLINKYVSALIQGMSKGNEDLVNEIKRITNENWQANLRLFQKYGEELSTRLMLPIMMLFLSIMMILLTPVLIQLNALI